MDLPPANDLERTRYIELFEAALRTVPIAMAIIDRDLRYIRVNAACAAMTGIPVDAHAGRTLRDVNPLLSPELEGLMRRVIATGEPCMNHRLTRPTPHAPGGSLEIAMHITAFRDRHGNIEGICSTATDMTAWQRLQQQFFQAQKLEAAGRLSASIAHDFNNLITIIGSYCDLVLMDLPATSPHRADIEEIRGASNRAAGLARRMLGTVRSTALAATPIDIGDTVRAARELLAQHAMHADAQLSLACDEISTIVIADATQIEQILLNLVINALDAMPAGGTVTVTTTAVTLLQPLLTRTGQIPPGEYVELSVSDTGTGMDAATLDRIFEPFFTTKPRGKGTGLGLATVLGIARELRGGVDLTTAPGAGTTFRVLLPRLMGTADVPAAAASTDGATLGGSETLLVVNDEDALRAGMARLLARQGYRVLEARHGGEALRVMAEEPAIDLIVSDLHMPGIGGHELAERARELNERAPILFMSSSAQPEDEPAGLPSTAGPNDRFLGGRVEPNDLLRTVREMLAR